MQVVVWGLTWSRSGLEHMYWRLLCEVFKTEVESYECRMTDDAVLTENLNFIRHCWFSSRLSGGSFRHGVLFAHGLNCIQAFLYFYDTTRSVGRGKKTMRKEIHLREPKTLLTKLTEHAKEACSLHHHCHHRNCPPPLFPLPLRLLPCPLLENTSHQLPDQYCVKVKNHYTMALNTLQLTYKVHAYNLLWNTS